jgi:hypothetical protein
MRFYNEKEGRVFTPDEFNQEMVTKYNRKSFRGLELMNAMGDIDPTTFAYQYTTDRLTYIRSRYVEQTFYEVAPADFMNVLVGEGAFSAQIITNLSIKTAGGFKQGKMNTSGHNSKLNVADAAVVPLYTQVMNWALGTEYSIFDVNQALFTGTWDPIEAKQKARKKDFDLGIQEIAFLGDETDASFPGLLTSKTVNINASGRISAAINSFSTTSFASFVANVLGDFQSNCNYTAFPNKFVIPTDDYVGLATPVSSSFPVISMLEYLQKAFNAIVPGGVEILPCAYGIPANNKAAINTGTGSHVYVLYKDDIDTLFMEIPVNYTVTQVGTYNNFNFQDAAYCQYTGVTIVKPLEVLYYTW